MSMIGTGELNRAAFEDAEVARTFGFHASAAREVTREESRDERTVPYVAMASGFSHDDAVTLPGVRMFRATGFVST